MSIAILYELIGEQDAHFGRLKGLFPSERAHPLGYRRSDNSAYFTATLLYTLRSILPFCKGGEVELIEAIRQKACFGVAPFQNKQGLPRYNFWKTHPADHFPNGLLLGRWEYFRPPDDADDSVMIYMMQNRTQAEAQWLMEHIDSYANGQKKWVKNAPVAYQKFKAWCTFFCKDMPLGFDACVICNLLCFNLHYQLPDTDFKKESVAFLVQMLREKHHLTMPHRMAPYYPKTSLILYHLARVFGEGKIPELEDFRLELMHQAEHLLQSPLSHMERQILENTWMKLAHSLPPPRSVRLSASEPFFFFVLPLTQEFEGHFFQWLAQRSFTHIRFFCSALEKSIDFENQVLKRKFTASS